MRHLCYNLVTIHNRYHIVWGEKIFYFIRPTAQNLKIYESWSQSPTQSSTFLPHLIAPGETYQVHLRSGDTMIIPGGWIHAVYTPVNSLVFGGNFLHFACVGRQLQVNGIEERTHVGKKYRFPYFKHMMWYVTQCSQN
jgi:F-box/leucine-rich repeat protein 10/11